MSKFDRSVKVLALAMACSGMLGSARVCAEDSQPERSGAAREKIARFMEARRQGPEAEMDDASSFGARWRGPYPAGAKVDLDVAYGTAKLEAMDVYVPARGSELVPLVVMVHGGGWRRGDKAQGPGVQTKVEHYLAKGVAVATIDYPLVPESDPHRQAVEIGKALAKLEGLAGKYGLDMSKAALMGHSAGAHLVDLLASNPELARQAGYKGGWRAVVSLDTGSMDVEQTMRGRHFGLYDTAFGKDEKLWARANPMRALSKDPGPMLLVCSSTRRDSCPQARAYEKKAAGFGAKSVKAMPVDLNHGKVNSEVGKPGAYTEAIDAFLAAHGVVGAKK